MSRPPIKDFGQCEFTKEEYIIEKLNKIKELLNQHYESCELCDNDEFYKYTFKVCYNYYNDLTDEISNSSFDLILRLEPSSVYFSIIRVENCENDMVAYSAIEILKERVESGLDKINHALDPTCVRNFYF